MHGVGVGLGVAMAAGAPALVLVSVGAVAVEAGTASIVVWPLSALIGLLMAIPFAQLAAAYPAERGGVAVLAANVLRPRSPFLARLAQWSYWLGWSPAMALSAALLASIATARLWPGASPWFTWLVATGILAAMAVVNCCGLRACALMQVTLVAALATPIAVGVVALLVGDFSPARLVPLAPAGGWASWEGAAGLAGAFFLAGWSAYAAEIALAHAPDYRRGTRDAARVLFAVAAIVVAVYTLVPLLLVGAFGAGPLGSAADDLGSLVGYGRSTGVALSLLAGAVLLITLNTIAAADARVLSQMSRSGDAWAFLGQSDAGGVPRNALAFDVVANAAFLAGGLALSGGDVTSLPVTLLAAAGVGYFLSLSLALVAAWSLRRTGADARAAFRVPRVFLRLGIVLAAFNLALVLVAGASLGWAAVAGGTSVLVALVALSGKLARAPRRARARPSGLRAATRP